MAFFADPTHNVDDIAGRVHVTVHLHQQVDQVAWLTPCLRAIETLLNPIGSIWNTFDSG